VLVDKFSTSSALRGYKKGDVVISRCPYDAHKTVCKRITAVGGEVVTVRERAFGLIPSTREPFPMSTGEIHKVNQDAPMKPTGSAETRMGLSGSRRMEREQQIHQEQQKIGLYVKERHVPVPEGHVWLAGDNPNNRWALGSHLFATAHSPFLFSDQRQPSQLPPHAHWSLPFFLSPSLPFSSRLLALGQPAHLRICHS
jgi:hypothetical protein